MYLRLGISLVSGLVAAVLLAGDSSGNASEVAQGGVEVLGRGPVHEAFAQPLDVPQAGPVAPKPPPEPIEEQPPAQKPEGEDVQWVPGYWQWDDERSEFLWVSGVWRNPPPARKWVPGSWRQTENGWQWSDGFWAPENADSLEYLPPPPASVEEGPTVEAPSDDAVYVPGLWVYRESRYVWRPGYWLRSRPGWIWNPAYYLATSAGYLYVPGCWDYPLESRGLLFAPVCFTGGVYPRSWSPSYAVSLDFLPSALFVRNGCRQYYYGDYFTAGYRRHGFTPWIDYSVSRGAGDPLYGYYRTVNAGRPWERNVRSLYADRFAGRADRPPRTLERQNAGNVTVLRPLAQAAPPRTRLVEIDHGERIRQQQIATQFRSAAVQRSRTERELVVNRQAPTRAALTPRSVKIDVPRTLRTTPSPRIETHRSFTPSPALVQPTPRIETPRVFTPPPHQPLPRIEPVKPAKPLPTLHQPPVHHYQPQPIPTPKPIIHAPPHLQAQAPRPAPVIHPAPVPRPAPVIHSAPAPRPAPAHKPPSKPAPQHHNPKR